MEKKFEISVIVRTDKNLELIQKTIESIENQSLSFSKNIQVILISGKNASQELLEFCEKYQIQYSENVLVLEKLEMKFVKGRWINILWAGQEWQERAFKRLLALEENSPQKMAYAIECYSGTKETNYTELAINSVEHYQDDLSRYFFSRKFDKLVGKAAQAKEKLDIVAILAQIIVKSERIGVLRDIERQGRKPKYKKRTREWYLEKIPEFEQKISKMISDNGEEHEYQLQYILVSVLAESVKGNPDKILTEQEIREYEAKLKSMLLNLDDYILGRANINAVTRRYMFSLKYGKDIAEELVVRKGNFFYQNIGIYNLVGGAPFQIAEVQETENGIKIRGLLYHSLPQKDVAFVFTDGRQEIPVSKVGETDRIFWCLDYNMRQETICECEIPSDMDVQKTRLMCRYRGLYPIYFKTLGEFVREANTCKTME